MKIKAYAKINLTLDITGKRDDGYHLIDSVFQSVSLYDDILVEKSDDINVWCDSAEICSDTNIAYKAAKKFFEYTNICKGADIRIIKHIPLTSGMGGGSADAAAVITALDKLYKTNLTETQLCDIALTVGADVPFCITGGTARVGGIGEKIVKISDMPDCNILIIKHGQKVSTADMYKKIDQYPQTEFFTEKLTRAVENADLTDICKNVYNRFSKVCNNETVVADMKETSPLAVSLSGSGPSVFAIYGSADKANEANIILKQKGYKPFLVKPQKNGLEFD